MLGGQFGLLSIGHVGCGKPGRRLSHLPGKRDDMILGTDYLGEFLINLLSHLQGKPFLCRGCGHELGREFEIMDEVSVLMIGNVIIMDDAELDCVHCGKKLYYHLDKKALERAYKHMSTHDQAERKTP
jgi:hypothetical protein